MIKLLRAISLPATASRYLNHIQHQHRRHLCQLPTERILSTASAQVSSTPLIQLIDWPYHLRIRPNDILDPSDVNSLRATLVSEDPDAASVEPLRIHLSDTNRITIETPAICRPQTTAQLTCILEVPVQSDLDIESTRNVHVEKLYADSVRLLTSGDISTRNLNGFRFQFETTGGNVHCAGNTLANQIDIRARGAGNIHLAKMQGDLLYVICDSGCIRTDSCYSEASKFVTLNGRLQLDNVHKFSEMYLLEGGRLDVTGFHGRLVAKLNGGGVAQLQLTEVYGDSCIEAMGAVEGDELRVNISDFVIENNELEVEAERVELDARLAELEEHLADGGKVLRRENPNLSASGEDRLVVRSTGAVRLGRMSWTDTLKLKFDAK